MSVSEKTMVRTGGRWAAAPLMLYALLALTSTAVLFLVQAKGAVFWGSPKPRNPAAIFVAVQMALMAAYVFIAQPVPIWRGRTILIAAIVSVVITGLIAVFALLSFPNSGDEYAYLFQAWTFEAGRLWNPAPIFGDLVVSNYTWIAHGKWVGQYPPAWPLLIAGGSFLGFTPWMLNAGFCIAIGWIVYSLVYRAVGIRGAAAAAGVIVLMSPFTIFNAASFFPHVMAGFCVILACWTLREAMTRNRLGFMVLCGATIGLLGLTRTNSAMIAALPIGTMLLLTRRWRFIVAMSIGGLPFLAGLLLYQKAITGDPFTPVYYMGGRTVDHLYFEWWAIKEGFGLTIGKAVETSLWISPLALPLWLLAMITRLRAHKFDAVDAIYPLAILIFTFYPLDPGNRYGPRYYFEFWPLMIVTIASAAPAWSATLRRYTAAAAIATVIYGLVLMPFLARDYHRIVVERNDLYQQAARLHLNHAVVCVTAKSGVLPLSVRDSARNGISADGSVLFGHCDNVPGAVIRATFPGYKIWLYERGAGEAVGRLRQMMPLLSPANSSTVR